MAPEVCEFGKTSEGSCQNLKSSVKCCVRVEGVGEQVVRTKSATCVSLVNVGVIFNVNGNDKEKLDLLCLQDDENHREARGGLVFYDRLYITVE